MQKFIWAQRTGDLLLQDGPGISSYARGYSGMGVGKNNPDMQEVHSVGPIPRGEWLIEGYADGMPKDTPTHGPFVLRLTPKPGTQTFGRSGFLIHGDNPTHTASEGCVILPRPVREMIWASGIRDLSVVEFPPSLAA